MFFSNANYYDLMLPKSPRVTYTCIENLYMRPYARNYRVSSKVVESGVKTAFTALILFLFDSFNSKSVLLSNLTMSISIIALSCFMLADCFIFVSKNLFKIVRSSFYKASFYAIFMEATISRIENMKNKLTQKGAFYTIFQYKGKSS